MCTPSPLPHTYITTTACVTVPDVGITNVTSGSLYMTSDTSVVGPCVEHQLVWHREGGGDRKRREVGVMTLSSLCGACAHNQTQCNASLHNPATHTTVIELGAEPVASRCPLPSESRCPHHHPVSNLDNFSLMKKYTPPCDHFELQSGLSYSAYVTSNHTCPAVSPHQPKHCL